LYVATMGGMVYSRAFGVTPSHLVTPKESSTVPGSMLSCPSGLRLLLLLDKVLGSYALELLFDQKTFPNLRRKVDGGVESVAEISGVTCGAIWVVLKSLATLRVKDRFRVSSWRDEVILL